MTTLEKAASKIANVPGSAVYLSESEAKLVARAVLLAIREPDEGMVQAMMPAVGELITRERLAFVFTDAIDHILGEG